MLNRITRAVLIALLSAAALARAELGADTEASVLFTPAFAIALLPALAAGWIGAPAFGDFRPTWIVAAAGTVLLALALGAVAVWLMTGAAPAMQAARLASSPLGLGSACAAFGVTQLLAWRQARGPFGRRR